MKHLIGIDHVILAEAEKANILLVDDQPGKLLSYEAILSELGENLIKTKSAREALECLLRTDVALVLIDVCMPELDGFELATMIREHPRFRKTPLIFVSAVQITEFDRLRGYEAGAVDYVPVPVVPDLLRAKVKVFVDLHRTSRELQRLNAELEERVARRTTELEAVATRLQESEQRRSLALAAGRMGSWERDLLTGEHIWDDGQFAIYGVSPDTFRPDEVSVRGLIYSKDLPCAVEAEEAAVAAGESFYSEFRIVRPDGSLRWCIVGAAVTCDANGRPVRLTGVTHDITDRKVLEQSLQDQKEQLELVVEARTREREVAMAQLFESQKLDTIGQLTGGVAHDFNNLLMVILGSLELLRKRLATADAGITRLIDNAIQGAERGSALTQRLLAFARRQELSLHSIDARELIRGMRDLLERAIGPSILLNLQLPQTVELVRADPNQLELAILNLAVNSRDAMRAGGSLTLIVCPAEESLPPVDLPPGAFVCIEVADTGVGMDEATLSRSREPFFTTKGPGKGTGLGLSMVHGLVAQSGGIMTIMSELGRGTRIRLFIPTAQLEAEPLPPISSVASEVQETEPAQSFTILLVDDDHLVLAGTAAMIEDLGHSVIEADSAAQALFCLNSGAEVDLVITDHAMPGMTGLSLIETLRVSHPSLPAILASGFAEIAEQERVADVSRLLKPFRQKLLSEAISSALARQTSTGIRSRGPRAISS